MKILVVGGGGQLGSKLIQCAKDHHELYATYLTRRPQFEEPKTFRLDKRDRAAAHTLLDELRPDAVIDTGALHNVDYCETHKDEAWAVNVTGTRNLADACSEFTSKMIFVSTDYVFDSGRGHYSEEDPANPVNYYGVTKLEAEKSMIPFENCVIARPSVLYSYAPPKEAESSSGKPLNFAMWLLQRLRADEPVKVVTDQYGSPTLADNMAEVLLKLAETDDSGLYHVAGRSKVNRYEFAAKLAEKLDLDAGLIAPVGTDQLKQTAKRPADSSLNVTKIEKTLGLEMLEIDEALELFRDQASADE